MNTTGAAGGGSGTTSGIGWIEAVSRSNGTTCGATTSTIPSGGGGGRVEPGVSRMSVSANIRGFMGASIGADSDTINYSSVLQLYAYASL